MAISTTSKNVYSGYNVKIDMIVRENNTSAPEGSSAEWDSSGNVLFIGTNFRSSASADVTNKHGIGQQRPYDTKQSYLEYEFSIESMYTIDRYYTDSSGNDYDILELIDNDATLDIRVSILDGIGEDTTASAVRYIVLEGCSLQTTDFEVGTDRDASCSLSGKAEGRTITPAT